MISPEWLTRLCEWIKKNPYKAIIFIEIPLCIITSIITNLLIRQ